MMGIWTLLALGTAYTYHQQGQDWPGTCSLGKLQSPIDLTAPQLVNIGYSPLFINYRRLTNYQAEFDSTGYRVKSGEIGTLQGRNADGFGPFAYTATEIRFHAPSEHTIDGLSFDLEMQIVHTSLYSGNSSFPIAILSILFREGVHNPLMAGIFEADEGLDLFRLLGERWRLEDYWAYQGSMTQPPCDEVVNWYIWPQVQTASWRQIDFFRNHWRWNPLFAGGLGNNRAIQQRNSRNLVRFRGYY